MRSYNPVRKGHGGPDPQGVQLLLTAKRPYIYTGGGVILGNASAELRELVDLLGYPVHQHADGPGRRSRPATASSWACWACTAPTKPT
jgi:acetolactate synthase-1/2/3 large subunit